MLDKKTPHRSNNITNLKDSFVLLEITEMELIKIIQSMKNNKSAGLDDISPYLLAKCIPHIIKPLLQLVNVSIREGIFPSKLKKSVVKPIYKKGKKEDAINYQPIALVPALSKVLEKVISNRLIAFLEKHNILNKSQYGFRKNESMNVAIATKKVWILKQTATVYYWTYQKNLIAFNIFLWINYINMISGAYHIS
jgi:hypothetical protein